MDSVFQTEHMVGRPVHLGGLHGLLEPLYKVSVIVSSCTLFLL